jgi:glucosamine--fructose-6-phosphate aminotransferase (isomerizing)
MCGIIGYLGKGKGVEIALEGLRHLEYRGYDSAGIAFLSDGDYTVRRCQGKIRDLEAMINDGDFSSPVAVGHTRWATHGVPSEYNSHPHSSDSVILVHNGIIENYRELKEELEGDGYVFRSETDTEVLAHLVDREHRKMSIEEAVTSAFNRVHGAYACLILSRKEKNKIVGIRKDSPLVLGMAEGEYFIASDIPAFIAYTRDVVFLEDGDMVLIDERGLRILDSCGGEVSREVHHITWSPSVADKGGYRHYMLKEIHEQPRALSDTLRGRILQGTMRINGEEFGLSRKEIESFSRIVIAACGTSFHAALAGKYMIEGIARIPVEVDHASEFRYRDPLLQGDTLFISITQSGETADTLAAQREAKGRGLRTLTICNVLGATSAREADSVFYTHSGPEMGVASTKAFTAQLVSLYMLAVLLGQERGLLNNDEIRRLIESLMMLPEQVEKVCKREDEVKAMAKEYFRASDFLFLGRGLLYPIALEGALKLKEISYIHAEGYPAGEMKHGPIALVDEDVPSVFLVQPGLIGKKVLSNIEEIRARKGRVIVFTSTEEDGRLREVDSLFVIPGTNACLETVLMAVPLQLLAYHIGVLRGCDVDQPRNLAKSVTVE